MFFHVAEHEGVLKVSSKLGCNDGTPSHFLLDSSFVLSGAKSVCLLGSIFFSVKKGSPNGEIGNVYLKN